MLFIRKFAVSVSFLFENYVVGKSTQKYFCIFKFILVRSTSLIFGNLMHQFAVNSLKIVFLPCSIK